MTRGNAVRAALAALAAPVWLAGAARLTAQGLASPGPLSQAHASLDAITRCLDCHDAGRELSGRKCLGCHVSLARRIESRRGFHAEATRNGTALACASCHSEHNGRPYRLVRWDGGRDAFDHRRTGFALDGRHARAPCVACHRAGLITDPLVRTDSSLSRARTYLGLGTTCAACHLDEHRGRVSARCETCHTTDAWKPAPAFDHQRTDFPLTGLHVPLACNRCHTVRRAPATGPGGARDSSFLDFGAGRAGASGCAGCHASPHRDRSRMARCETCHSTAGWFVLGAAAREFDHARTGMPLRGAHAASRCEACHLSSPAATLPAGVALNRANFLRPFRRAPMAFDRCDACHATPHEPLATARDCAACHDERRFTPTTFGPAEHDSTTFPLTGAHRATACRACHAPLPGGRPGNVAFRRADRSCTGCHADPHRGQFAPRACEACHTTEAWSAPGFDHERTRYPLRGAHRAAACAACHTRPNPAAAVRYAGLPATCAAGGCHADPHGGQFAGRSRGDACTACHTETAWNALLFDHQSDTDWPLDGAHRTVPCAACHRTADGRARWRPVPHRCEDCHTAERRP